ncbi:MAG: hypothetical protein V2B18_25330 [Pseudomonadota bacterium]
MNGPALDESRKGCCKAEQNDTACCQSPDGEMSSHRSPGQASWKNGKILVSVIIILAAIGVGAHSFVKATSAKSDNTGSGKSFAAGLSENPNMSPGAGNQDKIGAKPQEIPLHQPLDSLKTLDALAADKDVVFLVLPGEPTPALDAIPKPLSIVSNNLLNSGQRVGLFTLKRNSPDYDRLTRHFAIKTFPFVLVLGRQGSAATLSGDITEAGLYNAFVQASKPVSCCPAPNNASCCPK